MQQIKIMVFNKRKIKRVFIQITTSTIGIYLFITLYFVNHFPFHTEINGMNVSLKSYHKISKILDQFARNYKLQLFERNGNVEVITSQDIGMQYNKNITISQIKPAQNPLLWINSLFNSKQYHINNLYDYNKTLLEAKINNLSCMTENIVMPQNVGFTYSNGSYEFVDEIYGNQISKSTILKEINQSILMGKTKLDLDKNCYINPKYTVKSEKAIKTKNLLNKYVSTKITYSFGNRKEQLDGTTIHQWLSVDENLDIVINKQAIANYVSALSKNYNTVGITREFQSSTGKNIELKGGLYGWMINSEAETETIIDNIKNGKVLEREPVYLQKANSREGNEIGNTYIEISITRQHLWFYKDGKLITQGSIVTGNPNRNNATVLGAYMINYIQKHATLKGPGYEAKVTYWMPFFGNIGLHDASWRRNFGGSIYTRNGTHGCVNLPLYLAKTIFENIEAGIPVIIYEEGAAK